MEAGGVETIKAQVGDVPDRECSVSALARLLFPNDDPIGKHTLLWKGKAAGSMPMWPVLPVTLWSAGLTADRPSRCIFPRDA